MSSFKLHGAINFTIMYFYIYIIPQVSKKVKICFTFYFHLLSFFFTNCPNDVLLQDSFVENSTARSSLFSILFVDTLFSKKISFSTYADAAEFFAQRTVCGDPESETEETNEPK